MPVPAGWYDGAVGLAGHGVEDETNVPHRTAGAHEGLRCYSISSGFLQPVAFRNVVALQKQTLSRQRLGHTHTPIAQASCRTAQWALQKIRMS